LCNVIRSVYKSPMLSRDNAFWQFSLAVYAAPGVADECLALQERYGVDVNVLMFSAWIGSERKIQLTPEDIGAIAAVVTPWHESAVKPLRSVRRYMKGLSQSNIDNLRARVKGAELAAEQVEQAMLFAYAEERWAGAGNEPSSRAVAHNLETFLSAQGLQRRSGEEPTVRCLCEAVSAREARAHKK
jgi:uncharacterized protein (TIGR02444 family)